MNQGKIWLVVKPSVGLPMMLGAVAITALLVHYTVLTSTTWFPAFIQGGQKTVAAPAPAAPAAPAAAQPAKK